MIQQIPLYLSILRLGDRHIIADKQYLIVIIVSASPLSVPRWHASRGCR